MDGQVATRSDWRAPLAPCGFVLLCGLAAHTRLGFVQPQTPRYYVSFVLRSSSAIDLFPHKEFSSCMSRRCSITPKYSPAIHRVPTSCEQLAFAQ